MKEAEVDMTPTDDWKTKDDSGNDLEVMGLLWFKDSIQ